MCFITIIIVIVVYYARGEMCYFCPKCTKTRLQRTGSARTGRGSLWRSQAPSWINGRKRKREVERDGKGREGRRERQGEER